MKRVVGAAVICCMCLTAVVQALAGEAPADLAAARDAYQRNIALGELLGGKPATAEQAAAATRSIDEGLEVCRACVAADARDAAAHALAGMLLCAAYRPAPSKVIVSDEQTGEVRKETITVLRRGSKDHAEEGLAELRAAMRLDPDDADYKLDCAEAVQICGDTSESVAQASAVWENRTRLTPQQRARAAGLLASAMRTLGRTRDEMRWLREVLAGDPGDSAAGARLAELVAQLPPAVTWQSYEAGMASARQEAKPVLIDFSATWCGWCKKLEEEVFTNSDVIALSQRFVCIKVDGDRRADLTRTYRVDGYPTTVFLDSQGREVNRVGGYEPADRYLADMQRALPSR